MFDLRNLRNYFEFQNFLYYKNISLLYFFFFLKVYILKKNTQITQTINKTIYGLNFYFGNTNTQITQIIFSLNTLKK